MQITALMLIGAGLNPTQAKIFAEPFSRACARFEINTIGRCAAFFAQCAHESMGFTRLEEGMYYRDPHRLAEIFRTAFKNLASNAVPYTRNPQALANKVYGGILGNGDEASGDGWRYRGRGLIQVTFRHNYRKAAQLTGEPYEDVPEMLTQPLHACLSSAAWWFDNGCNLLADAGLIDQITAKVNKRSLGANERREHYREALTAFNREQ